MEKNIIIIDDEDQNPQKEYIESKLKREYDIEVHLINTNVDQTVDKHVDNDDPREIQQWVQPEIDGCVGDGQTENGEQGLML